MRTEEENRKLSDMLFSDTEMSPEDIFNLYPKRNLKEGAMVLRFAPSPTGFLHIGGVLSGLISSWMSKQSKGISILRIEDTDKTREIENGVRIIVEGLSEFGIHFDEGVSSDGADIGMYGPYMQSKRLNIYRVFAKEMVKRGFAYPCFLTKEDLEKIRLKQVELGVRTGCYGDWAKWKNADFDEVKERLENGDKYVIRLASSGRFENTFEFVDLIKGKSTLHENDMDAVLLKSDGYPTYHFAHPIDDTLMGITHVIRGDEWFSSVPLHVELFEKLGFTQIPYAHIPTLMKIDNGGKRKLSKRKDPEADVEYYASHGYPPEGITEYLLNLANSNFYDWRKQNPKADLDEFKISFEKFNKAGALFDIDKLNDVCKEYIASLSGEDLYERVLNWSKKYNSQMYELLLNNKEYNIKVLNIERTGKKIRKDFVKYEDVYEQIKMFNGEIEEYEDITDRIEKEEQVRILREYLGNYKQDENAEVWFENLKAISKKLGYCADRNEFENNARKYKGMVSDVAMVVRVAVTGKTKSPDLYQVMNVLGESEVKSRIERYISKMI